MRCAFVTEQKVLINGRRTEAVAHPMPNPKTIVIAGGIFAGLT